MKQEIVLSICLVISSDDFNEVFLGKSIKIVKSSWSAFGVLVWLIKPSEIGIVKDKISQTINLNTTFLLFLICLSDFQIIE
jgi:predicted metal-binding transcription factor (methanogenesis marker protein 9)